LKHTEQPPQDFSVIMVIAFPSELYALIFKGQNLIHVPQDLHFEIIVKAEYFILDNSLIFFCKLLEADFMLLWGEEVLLSKK